MALLILRAAQHLALFALILGASGAPLASPGDNRANEGAVTESGGAALPPWLQTSAGSTETAPAPGANAPTSSSSSSHASTGSKTSGGTTATPASATTTPEVASDYSDILPNSPGEHVLVDHPPTASDMKEPPIAQRVVDDLSDILPNRDHAAHRP